MAAPGVKQQRLTAVGWNPAWLRISWSAPAAMRAIRATIVIPSLFAITSTVIGDPQMALFATFGGFATLVVTSFGGSRRDKLGAHLGLAIAGSVALTIGTLVSGSAWLAALVTLPVVFAVFFAGVLGPAPATASVAILFSYVLPVASAGGAATIGGRLEGWWLASAAGTLAVLLLSPRSPGDRIRAAASALAGEIASRIRQASVGEASDPAATRAAKERLRAAFTGAPYRPTGLATADQALASVVQLLDWAASQVADAFDGHIDLTRAAPEERQLLGVAAGVFDDIAALLAGRDADPALEQLELARAAATEHLRSLAADSEPAERMGAAHAVHAQAIAVAARSGAADALIAARRADPATIAAERRQWYGTTQSPASQNGTAPGRTASLLSATDPGSRLSGVAGAAGVVVRHASVRSVWFANSLRAAAALAVAVAVADLTGVQHGFWVVLGTLSVLRSNAAGTGATALRALGGTAIGFVAGAALLAGIGTGQTAMWVAFPLAIAVAAYAPGTAPFAIGQAAFTIVIVVLFNLLDPVGWKVGLLRVEDVAIGCAVSVVVGVVFWPRGAAALVGDDLADAFRSGGAYLTQAVEWALSERPVPPDSASVAVTASLRLDDALRGFLAEQGTKRASKEDLWTLVTATRRLQLTAHSLAGLRDVPALSGAATGPACLPLEGSEAYAGTQACVSLRMAATQLAGFYGRVADEVGHPGREVPELLAAPPVTGGAVPRHEPAVPGTASREAAAGGAGAPSPASRPHPHLLWVQEHLHHLSQSAQMIREPALRVAEARRRPWWG
ncbi:MAG TPA: FUSC family protein [Trebonia sp.]|nr:FUSC family protein [Trebonia sp.]